MQGSEKEERVRERGRCGGGSYCECNTRYWHTTALVMDIIFGRREESREKRERESREEGAAGVYFSSLRVHFLSSNWRGGRGCAAMANKIGSPGGCECECVEEPLPPPLCVLFSIVPCCEKRTATSYFYKKTSVLRSRVIQRIRGARVLFLGGLYFFWV